MKRSEMIELIQRHLIVYFDIRDIDKNGCESLLDLIEKEGMNPPERVRYSETKAGTTICSPECTWDEE